MPVVKTESRTFGGVPFKLVVKCDADGEFTAALPVAVRETVGKSHASGMSLDACLADFDAMVKRCNEANSTTRRIIKYEFKGHLKLRDADGFVRLEFDSLSFCDGVGLALYAEVFDETEIKVPGARTRYVLKAVGSPLDDVGLSRGRGGASPDGLRSVPWTQQTEDFFRKIGEALIDVAEKLSNLTDTPEALLAGVNSLKRITE